MSRRPSAIRRIREETSTSSVITNHGYAIIGNAAASILYARRLIQNNVTAPIYIITSGVDRTNLNCLEQISFPATNIKSILHFLYGERIHYITSGDDADNDDDEYITETDRIIQHYVGNGALGDMISSYFSPRLGPWFSHTSNQRMQKFLQNHVTRRPLNAAEQVVAERLKTMWNIPLTKNLINQGPSILNTHFEMIKSHDEHDRRELFLEQYQQVNDAPNVDIISETSNIKFTPNPNGSTYDISGSNFSLTNVKPIFKTNLYSYLRLSTAGGLHPDPIWIPTFYRAVISIPISGSGYIGVSPFVVGQSGRLKYDSGIDLRGLSESADMIITHNSFSLYDIGNPKSAAVAWMGQIYTTREDLSIVDPRGLYASEDHVLLIVEAICIKNRRQARYNVSEGEIQLSYNPRVAERNYREQFGQILSDAINVYTGVRIHPTSFIEESSVCSASGICGDNTIIQDFSLRQSPMNIVLDMAASLYKMDSYPSCCC